MKYVLRTIKNADLKGKKVLLRTGWDVPLKQVKSQKLKVKSKVVDDLRIRESLPTIKYLIKQGVKSITIAFHLGRPGGRVLADLSVKPVVMMLVELLNHSGLGFNLPRSPRVEAGRQAGLKFGFRILDLKIAGSLAIYEISGASIPVTILENLRFDPREQNNDKSFAQKLAQNHDLYINDAFSNCHRKHASMVAITKFLPAYAGLLVEDEIRHLSRLGSDSPRPFVVIIGGAKIEDKMPVIETFAKTADAVLVGGKTGLIYKSKVENPASWPASTRGEPCEQKSKIFSPLDDNDGYDIGPETIELFTQKIKSARTIFWNGNMGKSEEERYAQGTQEIAEAIVRSQAEVKIAGGGDTTAYIHKHKFANKFTFLSSGGGATIDYLAGKEMPGLKPLVR